MPEITLYRVIFILSLLIGICFPLVTGVRIALIYAAMYGLHWDQLLEYDRYVREQERARQEQQVEVPVPLPPPRPNLDRPALPNEGV
jgi:hypothetical protein